MDALDAIRTRRSIRKYLSKPLEWEKVGVLLDAARLAPSSGNLQNWKFIIVKEDALKKQLAEASFGQYWMQDAPIHIVVCSEPAKARQFYGMRGDRLYSIQNCAAAIENILISAVSLGLGACWVSAFDEEKVKEVLLIPDSVRPQGIITAGYAGESPEEQEKFHTYDISFINKWGNKIEDIGMTLRELSTSDTLLNLKKDIDLSTDFISKHRKKVVNKFREKTASFSSSVSNKLNDLKRKKSL